jgi:hypothetical protein
MYDPTEDSGAEIPNQRTTIKSIVASVGENWVSWKAADTITRTYRMERPLRNRQREGKSSTKTSL